MKNINYKESYDVQSHAGNSSTRPQQPLAAMQPWRFLWPWLLTFWLLGGSHMPSNCH